MLHNLLSYLDRKNNFAEVSAHCDIPCKIYDPINAQISVLTIIRMVDLLTELQEKNVNDATSQAEFQRLITQKEDHGVQVKKEITTIWGDYIKAPQLEAFPELHQLTHSIMLLGSKAKQSIDKEVSLELLNKVNRFAEIFWQSKGIPTYIAECPYPPQKNVVYPNLKAS